MFSSNESSSPTPLLCIQMRKTTNYGSILQRRSLLMDVQNDNADDYTASLVTGISDERSNISSANSTSSIECSNIDIVYDELDALTKQDVSTYVIRDYIGRRSNRQQQQVPDNGNDDYYESTESADCDDFDLFESSSTPRETPIASYKNNVGDIVDESLLDVDESCREKMCEWSYRICDHFNTSREIVAIAFSYLDRFNDVTRCDRTAFKLASMTCLYIATKVFHNKQLSVSTLVELSRNEFTAQHIIQMERIILATLDYKMNPPTAQIFLFQYQLLLPIQKIISIVDTNISLVSSECNHHNALFSQIMNDIYDRATYYGELVVYDYSLVTEQRQNIAISCLFNAIYDVTLHGKDEDDAESYEQHERYEEFQQEFLEQLQNNLSSLLLGSIHIERVYEIQERLWYLYSCSADYHQNQQRQQCYAMTNNHIGYNNQYNHGYSTNATDRNINAKDGKESSSTPTSGSPISVVPTRVTGLPSDKFSVRIF